MELMRVDEEEEAVRIEGEKGEIVLGRGPLLQITELQMSRKVAKIRSEGENKFFLSRIKPIFAKLDSDDITTFRELDQDLELKSGMEFSLMRDKFVYRVTLDKDKENTDQNKENESKENGIDNEEMKGEKEKNPMKIGKIRKERKLPEWMMLNHRNKEEEKTGPKRSKVNSKDPISESEEEEVQTPKKSLTKSKKSSAMSESDEEEETTGPKRSKVNSKDPISESEEGEEVQTPKKSLRKSIKSSAMSESESDNQETTENKNRKVKERQFKRIAKTFSDEESSKSTNESPVKKVPKVHHQVSDDEEEDNEPNASRSEKNGKLTDKPNDGARCKRPACPYGDKCYRKNPIHRKEESHPGDSDYESVAEENSSVIDGEEDADDDRPECEYGLDCFRKNPQHRKDFKHTKKPRPKRKAKDKALKKKKKNGDDEEEEGDEYESSFIDDTNSEAEDITDDEESVEEWNPDTDSD